MKNRRIIGIVMGIFIALCFISNIYLLVSLNAKVMPKVGTVLNMVALVCASGYLLAGFRKQSQLFYKGFFVFYALHLLTGTYGMVMDFKPSVMCAAWILLFEVTFANLLLLVIPDNLGEKKSKVIASINLGLWIAFLIFDIVTGKLTSAIYAIRVISYVVAALLVAIMIFAKYSDKKTRGAK